MKMLLVIALAVLSGTGCVHYEDLCGNAVFIFVESGTRKVETNFRDNRLLRSDVVVRGSMTQWRPGPLWKVQGYYTLSLELDASVPVENIDLSVVSGHQGASGYLSIPIFRAESFVGKRQLVPFEVGGDNPDARLVLQFGTKGDPRRREIELRDVWSGKQNQAVETTRGT